VTFGYVFFEARIIVSRSELILGKGRTDCGGQRGEAVRLKVQQ
jgi:hypothetical protein